MSHYPTAPPPSSPPESPPEQTWILPTELEQPQPPPSGDAGRSLFGAWVLVAALVVGAGAGVGGAAAFDALKGDEAAPTSGTPQTSQVVDTEQTPATPGSVASVAQQVLPSVVRLDVAGAGSQGSGSGVVLSSDGEILTNDHVVEVAADGGEIAVSFNDGSKTSAEIIGRDPLTDTALIKADDVSGLTPIDLGASEEISVGQDVVAIGSPFGLDQTVTTGIVSALNRPVAVGQNEQGEPTTYPAIQTDAAINPGNSGGALVDTEGRLIGINSSIRSNSAAGSQAGSIGLGFAIPIDEVLPIVEQMRAGEDPTHAQLGISVSDVENAANPDVVEGGLVQGVVDGSAADEAGLEEGDVITQIDDRRVESADSLVASVRAYRPGDEVTVTYDRDGDTETATLELGSDADATDVAPSQEQEDSSPFEGFGGGFGN